MGSPLSWVVSDVKTASLDSLYKGLPVVVVQDWSEVTKEFLNKKYAELQQKTHSLEKLRLDYWIKLINSYKEAEPGLDSEKRKRLGFCSEHEG